MKVQKVKFSNKENKILYLRGLLGGIYMLTYFYAISKLKLGDVSILVQLSGVFVVIFSSIFLKEKLQPKTYIFIFAIIIGTCIIINPLKFSSYSQYAIFGVLAAAFSGAASITIRYLARSGLHHNYEIMFFFLFISTIVAIPLMYSNFIIPNGKELIILIIIGVVSFIAQIFLTGAFSHQNAIIVEFVRYIGIFINNLWGFIIFKETITLQSIIGGTIIVISTILLSKTQKDK
ncbi:MAG: DMT family transporter [Fusobacterium varium]|uniref:DMT family transporter n=1 Tax=Fusobacterium varium TaxID=856 RepID=UPI0024326569|nr:DMT family transporter [Fusobacterium varium]UYI77395.1 MAG: DMT family transporter [Fusobacterium varium]